MLFVRYSGSVLAGTAQLKTPECLLRFTIELSVTFAIGLVKRHMCLLLEGDSLLISSWVGLWFDSGSHEILS